MEPQKTPNSQNSLEQEKNKKTKQKKKKKTKLDVLCSLTLDYTIQLKELKHHGPGIKTDTEIYETEQRAQKQTHTINL